MSWAEYGCRPGVDVGQDPDVLVGGADVVLQVDRLTFHRGRLAPVAVGVGGLWVRARGRYTSEVWALALVMSGMTTSSRTAYRARVLFIEPPRCLKGGSMETDKPTMNEGGSIYADT